MRTRKVAVFAELGDLHRTSPVRYRAHAPRVVCGLAPLPLPRRLSRSDEDDCRFLLQRKNAVSVASPISDDTSPSPPPRAKAAKGAAPAKVAAAVSSPWPSDVRYVTSLVWGDDVKRAKEVYRKYKVSGDRPLESTASAVRERALAAHRGRVAPRQGRERTFRRAKALPGEHIVDYLGYVTLSGNEDQTSDYSASFGDDHELALDAAKVRNEARMCNDFRNTGKRANAVFDQYRDAAGDKKLAIFVGPHPMGKGEEVLVSYGKGFWANRVGNLAAFTGHHADSQPPR